MTEKQYFYQNKLFSVEDDLFYENDKRIGYFEDEEECEIKINNYKKTVDRLEELREVNIDLKRYNKKIRKENEQLKQDGLYWGQTAEARRKEIDKLLKDNTILKQQRDYLFDVIDEVLPHSGSTTAYNRMKDIGDVE